MVQFSKVPIPVQNPPQVNNKIEERNITLNDVESFPPLESPENNNKVRGEKTKDSFSNDDGILLDRTDEIPKHETGSFKSMTFHNSSHESSKARFQINQRPRYNRYMETIPELSPEITHLESCPTSLQCSPVSSSCPAPRSV